MIGYCHNCKGRPHATMYKNNDAFYDLNTVGTHETKANNLSVGQQCVVATRASDRQIVFSWHSFLHETVMKDKDDIPCRVFFGKFIKSDTRSKGDAAREGLYSMFFDKNGNFKRHSVIQR
jgi:hypothetical protein